MPWYQITRAESMLLASHARAIVQPLSGPIEIAELGCGSGEKLFSLLRAADLVVERVHFVDISETALAMARNHAESVGGFDVVTHHGTYEEGLRAIETQRGQRPLLMLLLGSNIGNFDPGDGRALLRKMRMSLRDGDALLLGSDLVKPERELRAAYDDPLQVTAAFNRNLLRRINDELGGTFDLEGFVRRAIWNADARRVEMHLVCIRAQRVKIRDAALTLEFGEGDMIWTESSYKYEPAAVLAEGLAVGFAHAEQWIEPTARFALTRFSA